MTQPNSADFEGTQQPDPLLQTQPGLWKQKKNNGLSLRYYFDVSLLLIVILEYGWTFLNQIMLVIYLYIIDTYIILNF